MRTPSHSAQAQLSFHEEFQDRLKSLLGPDLYGNGRRLTGYESKFSAVSPRSKFNDSNEPTTTTIHMTPPPASVSGEPPSIQTPWRELQKRLSRIDDEGDSPAGPPYGAGTRSPFAQRWQPPARPSGEPSRSANALNRLEAMTRQPTLRPEEVSALLQEVEDALQFEERGFTDSDNRTAPSRLAPLPPPPPPPPPPSSASTETLAWYQTYYAWMQYYQHLYLAAATATAQAPAPQKESRKCPRCSHCHHQHHRGGQRNQQSGREERGTPPRAKNTAATTTTTTAAAAAAARPPWISPTARSKSLPRSQPRNAPMAGSARRYDNSPKRPAPVPPPSTERDREESAPRGGRGSVRHPPDSALANSRQEDANFASQMVRLQPRRNQYDSADVDRTFPSPWRRERANPGLSRNAGSANLSTHRRLDIDGREEDNAAEESGSLRPGPTIIDRSAVRLSSRANVPADGQRSRSHSSVYERKREALATAKPSWR